MAVKKWSKKGKKVYNSNSNLENRVVNWLNSQFHYNCKKYESLTLPGITVKKEYKVDIHGLYKTFLGKVKAKKYGDVQKWYADILMLVSNIGFEMGAIRLVDIHNIYCVKANSSFNFVGKHDRSSFEYRRVSDY
ncbi:MAG: hypothetical protein AC479_06255 [miscellaneous Crenarchaeota group-6 archaeon AD8-1]|nr:MAG: hypothetical protein AC479_06255 [miscellaneous Crenarchaeota group-6 archaeon AD8-1]